METKFTPGPWRVHSLMNDCIVTEKGGSIADTVGHHDFKTKCANAALIAAAPELYATLEKVLESQGDVGGSMLNLKTAEMIWAALRQARGEK